MRAREADETTDAGNLSALSLSERLARQAAILPALPRSVRLRGGESLRRLVRVAEAMLSARLARAVELTIDDEARGALRSRVSDPESPPSDRGTLIGLRQRIRAQGTPAPRIWIGLGVEAEGDGLVITRSLGRSIVLAWSGAEIGATDPRAEAGTSALPPDDELAGLFRCAGLAADVPIGCAGRGILVDRPPRHPPLPGTRLEGRILWS